MPTKLRSATLAKNLCDLRVRQWPLAVDTYLLRPPTTVLLLRAVRLFFRPRVDVRRDVVRPRLLERSKLLARPSPWGDQGSWRLAREPRKISATPHRRR